MGSFKRYFEGLIKIRNWKNRYGETTEVTSDLGIAKQGPLLKKWNMNSDSQSIIRKIGSRIFREYSHVNGTTLKYQYS